MAWLGAHDAKLGTSLVVDEIEPSLKLLCCRGTIVQRWEAKLPNAYSLIIIMASKFIAKVDDASHPLNLRECVELPLQRQST